MIKGTYEELTETAGTYVCAEHGTMVVVCWSKEENCYTLRCQKGEYPEEVTREPSLTELNRQGELPDGPVKDNIERKQKQRAQAHAGDGELNAMALLPQKDLGTEQALTGPQIQLLVKYARHYGLDPFRGHVVMMYGQPYIGLDGYIWHAHRTEQAYQLRSRPLTAEERSTYQIPEGAFAWTSEVVFEDGKRSFTGLGIVTREETTEKSKKNPEQFKSPVVARHPWQLAQKRSEWQAMRRAFPIGEPEPPKEA